MDTLSSKTQSGPHLGSLVFCGYNAGLGRFGCFRRGDMFIWTGSMLTGTHAGSSELVVLCICPTHHPANRLLPAHCCLQSPERSAGSPPWSSPICSWRPPQRWHVWSPGKHGITIHQSLILTKLSNNLIFLFILCRLDNVSENHRHLLILQ